VYEEAPCPPSWQLLGLPTRGKDIPGHILAEKRLLQVRGCQGKGWQRRSRDNTSFFFTWPAALSVTFWMMRREV